MSAAPPNYCFDFLKVNDGRFKDPVTVDRAKRNRAIIAEVTEIKHSDAGKSCLNVKLVSLENPNYAELVAWADAEAYERASLVALHIQQKFVPVPYC